MTLWERYVEFCEKRPWVPLLAVVVVVGGLASQLWRIHVDAGLQALLPEGTETQSTLAEMSRRVAGSSPLRIGIRSDDPTLTRAMARVVGERISEWPETRLVIDQRDPQFFLDNRLLYLPAQKLEELADDLEELADWETCDRLPGCVNLDDRPEPPDEDDIRRDLEGLPEVQALGHFFGVNVADVALEQAADAAEVDRDTGARPGELCNETGEVCAVEAVLDGDPSNLGFAREILQRSRDLFDEIRPEDAPPSLELVVDGLYRNAPMTQEAVSNDLKATSMVGVSLVVVLLLMQFRGGFALLLLIIPTAAAIVATLGFVALIHPQLNMISAFTLAILAGMGVDFGVHLVTHYGRRRHRGRNARQALAESLRELARPMVLAAITSGSGFAALALGDFRGFSEMGPIAGGGILLAVVAFFVLVAPLVFVGQKIFGGTPKLLRPLGHTPFIATWDRLTTARIVAIAGFVAAVLLSAFVAPRVSLEPNFRKLSPSSIGHGIPLGDALGATRRTRVLLMADSQEELREGLTKIRESPHREGIPLDGALFVDASVFIPTDQAPRLAQLARMRESLASMERRARPDELTRIHNLQTLTERATPITRAELPTWLDEWLVERDGSFGRVGIIYLEMAGAHADVMEQLAEQIDDWRVALPGVRIASPQALLGELFPALRADAVPIVAFAVVALLVVLLLMERSLVRALVVMSPVALAFGVTLALMVLFDWKLHMFNMLVLPLAFGLGIDGSVYVCSASGSEASRTSARAVVFSTLTTAAAFGSLMVANNPGLTGLGQLAIVALTTTALANLVWLPAVLRVINWKAKRTI